MFLDYMIAKNSSMGRKKRYYGHGSLQKVNGLFTIMHSALLRNVPKLGYTPLPHNHNLNPFVV